MIYRQHIPAAPLSEHVAWFWYYAGLVPQHCREHVLPDGTFEFIINLQDEARHVFDRSNGAPLSSYRRGWLSGAQAQHLVIDAVPDSSMIGVHFKPGGFAAFQRAASDEMRDRVVELDAFWATAAWELRDQLLETRSVPGKFALLERFLLERLTARVPEKRRQRIQWALRRFSREPAMSTIGSVAREMGISHKHLVNEFRAQVGLTPKLFCRIRRFQSVLAHIAASQQVEWADVASACGYFDQAHFVRDFQAFGGLDPSEYLSYRVDASNFVPLPDWA